MRITEKIDDFEVYEGDFSRFFKIVAWVSLSIGAGLFLWTMAMSINNDLKINPFLFFLLGVVSFLGNMSVSITFMYLRKTAVINYEILKRIAKNDTEKEL